LPPSRQPPPVFLLALFGLLDNGVLPHGDIFQPGQFFQLADLLPQLGRLGLPLSGQLGSTFDAFQGLDLPGGALCGRDHNIYCVIADKKNVDGRD